MSFEPHVAVQERVSCKKKKKGRNNMNIGQAVEQGKSADTELFFSWLDGYWYPH